MLTCTTTRILGILYFTHESVFICHRAYSRNAGTLLRGGVACLGGSPKTPREVRPIIPSIALGLPRLLLFLAPQDAPARRSTCRRIISQVCRWPPLVALSRRSALMAASGPHVSDLQARAGLPTLHDTFGAVLIGSFVGLMYAVPARLGESILTHRCPGCTASPFTSRSDTSPCILRMHPF